MDFRCVSLRVGDGDQDAILLSPWPESVYAFEPAWQHLAAHAHLLAVDPPGFGKSDYRESLMNPKAMGNFIIRIADTFGFAAPLYRWSRYRRLRVIPVCGCSTARPVPYRGGRQRRGRGADWS